jgi:fumarate reductase subunit D
MSVIGRAEPVFWMLFGAGAMVCAMLLPAFFLVVAFGFPLGWFGTPEASFERMRFMLANPPAKAALGVMISLIFWHSAHHLRHFAYDLGYHNGAIAPLFYGLALLGTAAAFGVVSGL